MLVAYPSSGVVYQWHDPTLAVDYEGELQLSQFDIKKTEYRQVNISRAEAFSQRLGRTQFTSKSKLI